MLSPASSFGNFGGLDLRLLGLEHLSQHDFDQSSMSCRCGEASNAGVTGRTSRLHFSDLTEVGWLDVFSRSKISPNQNQNKTGRLEYFVFLLYLMAADVLTGFVPAFFGRDGKKAEQSLVYRRRHAELETFHDIRSWSLMLTMKEGHLPRHRSASRILRTLI